MVAAVFSSFHETCKKSRSASGRVPCIPVQVYWIASKELTAPGIHPEERNAILEKIEDEFDLECYYKSIEEYKKNPKTYTMEEMKKELGLD